MIVGFELEFCKGDVFYFMIVEMGWVECEVGFCEVGFVFVV